MRELCLAATAVLLLSAGGAAAQNVPQTTDPGVQTTPRTATPPHRSRPSTRARSGESQDRAEHAMTEELNRQQLQGRGESAR